MAEKEMNSQLDLFSENGQAASQNTTFSNSFFGSVRNYEKVIILSFCFLITIIISFSFGVEKGKRVALSEQDARFDVANNTQAASAKKLAITQELNKAQNKTLVKPALYNPKENVSTQIKTGNYIIQLASYQNKLLAQKDAESLKKIGLTPFMFSSKKGYTILCVGSFSNKDSAQQMLTELKKKYHDGFIRRL